MFCYLVYQDTNNRVVVVPQVERHQLSGRTSLEPPSWCMPITVPTLPPMFLHGEPSALLTSLSSFYCRLIRFLRLSLFVFFVQVLAGRLPSHRRGRDLFQLALPGVNGCSIYGQVRYFCQDEWIAWRTFALLLHDRRQDGQNAGAAWELLRSGSQSRHRGQWMKTYCCGSFHYTF